MYCSNCGKDIPFAGNVCPYCGADKSKDQQAYAALVMGGIGGAIIGWIVSANLIGEPCFGIIGVFPGGFIGALIGALAHAIVRNYRPSSRYRDEFEHRIKCDRCNANINVSGSHLPGNIVCYHCGKEFFAEKPGIADVRCGNCSAKLSVSETVIGHTVQCSECNRPFTATQS